ncbi:hypothetical protein [Rhizobium binae]|uniref:hypothetical protein n=1 Tax=Rhizobium binae TaxID=1138190 RepID=UPI001C829152|nr:hypothetical protein [Rhizobium binae]MBX4963679.1 hypothetical protein [Rhizobium binae]
MTENEPPKVAASPHKDVGALVNNIMLSISANERDAQTEDVGHDALWRDTRLLAYSLYVDNGVHFTNDRLRHLLTEP